MESKSGPNNTKISDSGYSNSCSNSNSNSHRSASSKSRHSGGSNSSRSSGFGDGTTKLNQSNELGQGSNRNKDREPKKKKQKYITLPSAITSVETIPHRFTVPYAAVTLTPPQIIPTGLEPVPSVLKADELEIDSALMAPVLLPSIPLITNTIEPIPMETDNGGPNLQPWIENDEIVQTVLVDQLEADLSKSDPMPYSQPEVNDGFCCVISMYDGVVLYTTPSLTSVLGFPKDTWLGHSFIDFVHPKDRDTFATHVSTSVTLPAVDSQGKIKDVRTYLYVCLKRYASAKPSGVPISYQAFHLTVTIKQLTDSPETRPYDLNNGLFLVIIAVPVYSAYKVPGERKKSTKFVMRHTAKCIFSYVDPDVVTNFGFLPQDMLGKSVFDFYHPEDMPLLKEVYRSVMKTCQISGSVFRSKPYRFLVQNGCFVMIETEWSSVINPWSRRVEFVISLHQVLQGPFNPNVFDITCGEEYNKIPEEVVRQGEILQKEILQFLTEELPRPVEIGKQEVSKRCKDLANFMESLMNTSKLQIDVGQEFNRSISERDSVMLGEISPHHDFCDSKSSSETPPSYNQLNYNENINRFFQSNPKTTVTSDESNSASNAMDTDLKNSQDCTPCAPNNQKCLWPIQNSGASGYDSAGNLSSSSHRNLESSTSGTNTSNDDYKPPHLTKLVLVRHNEDMEKIMIQKHKKERFHIKDRESKKHSNKPEKYANEVAKNDTNEHTQGVKRSGSRLWEDDCHKISKLNADSQITGNNSLNVPNAMVASNIQYAQPRGDNNNFCPVVNDANIWSPFSIVGPSPQNLPAANELAVNTPFNQGMVPLYYVPTLVQQRPVANNMEPVQRYQVQYMPAGLFYNYNPIFVPQPVLCPTVSIVPASVPNASISSEGRSFGTSNDPSKMDHSGSLPISGGLSPADQQQHFGNNTSCSLRPAAQCDRPSSQATSVKAEPGSRMGSIASASVINKALSECSRKDMGLQSVCSPDTPVVSPPDGETQAELFITNAKTAQEAIERTKQPELPAYRNSRIDEESSWYSSSYSSLLKTDTTGSGSNDDSSSNKKSNRTNDILKQKRKTYPMRKKDAPWVESVSVSSDLIYKYQVAVKDLQDILKSDLKILKETEQPMMVNDQLHQLYIEMELEGLSKALTLEEGFSSTSSSSSEETPINNNNSANNPNPSKPKKKRSYSALMMIYEENAPLPPPGANS